MKTTIYELIGMIKDNKAPKKIVFKEDIYEYRCSDCIDYYCDKDSGWLFDDYDITDILNDEVTILETTITYKPDKIEKLDEWDFSGNDLIFAVKINKIIDRLNKDQV